MPSASVCLEYGVTGMCCLTVQCRKLNKRYPTDSRIIKDYPSTGLIPPNSDCLVTAVLVDTISGLTFISLVKRSLAKEVICIQHWLWVHIGCSDKKNTG